MADDSHHNRERAVLVGIHTPDVSIGMFQSIMAELESLADSAGADIVASCIQNRDKPDGATYVGSGKLTEILETCRVFGAEVVVFDGELTPVQVRNIERALKIKVIDRTQLILDIFAARARTREGRLQVELAQLQYLMPRLAGSRGGLGRTGGGIGTRGPGEQKLELDRRRIRDRISDLKKDLSQVARHRELLRSGRRKSGIPLVSIVGYTNAGKTTLFNRLVRQYAPFHQEAPEGENKLFATLDTSIRRIRLPSARSVLLSDTVGFIQRLPHHLVAAFRSTLEETVHADVLLHVVDATNEYYDQQISTVESVLRDLHAVAPTILVMNKTDLIDVVPYGHKGVAVSAVTGQGIAELLESIDLQTSSQLTLRRIFVPFHETSAMARLHQLGVIRDSQLDENGWKVVVRIADDDWGRLQKQYPAIFQAEGEVLDGVVLSESNMDEYRD